MGTAGLAPRRCSSARPPLDGTFSPTQGRPGCRRRRRGAPRLSPGQVRGTRGAQAVTRGEGCGRIPQSKARRVSISRRRRESRGFPLTRGGGAESAGVPARACGSRASSVPAAHRDPQRPWRPWRALPSAAASGPPRAPRALRKAPQPSSHEVEGGETRTKGRAVGSNGGQTLQGLAPPAAGAGSTWDIPGKKTGGGTLAPRSVFF